MAWSDQRDLHTFVTRGGLIVLALGSALYLVALDRYPVVLGGDEAHFAVHAESIARTGRDLNGTLLPLFVNITDPTVPNHSSGIWYQPVLFYVMAPFIAALGISEWAARLPVALAAIADIWLVYAIGYRLLRSRSGAIAAGLLLALTPAHIIVGRQALDYIAPLPFVLIWFLGLLRFLDGGRLRDLVIGSLALGAGLFSYIAAWILMPLYFLLGMAAIWRSRLPTATRAIAASAAALALPLAGLAAAVASSPAMLANTLTRYALPGGGAEQPGLIDRVTLYWDYFNPSFLFFAGGANPTQATGATGVFLMAVLPLLLAGVREIVRRRDDRWSMVLVALLMAPVPIAVTMPPAAAYSIARVMTLLPFAVLVAALGLSSLQTGPWQRAIAAALLLSIPWQFAGFLNDYRGDYQLRAGPRLDPMHAEAVAAAVINHGQDRAPAIYLSHMLDDGGVRWRFVMVKRSRPDLLARTRQINLMDVLPAIEPGALIICYANDAKTPALVRDGYRVVATVSSVSGDPATVVLKAPG